MRREAEEQQAWQEQFESATDAKTRAQLAERDPFRDRPPRPGDPKRIWMYYEASLLQSLCDALIAQGKLPEAEQLADEVVRQLDADAWVSARMAWHDTGSNPFGRRAAARALLGRTAEALADFHAADELQHRLPDWDPERRLPPGGFHTALHAFWLARLGKPRSAIRMIERCNLKAAQEKRPLLAAQYELALAEAHHILGQATQAAHYAEAALAWGIQSDHRETYTRALLAQARALRKHDRIEDARSALQEADQVAQSCGHRVWHAEALIALGRIALHERDTVRAIRNATETLGLSASADCAYRWGIGSARHLLAEAELARGHLTVARQCAEEALAVRQSISDPRAKNTEQLLARLSS
jgi:tetratricopeptide (TPR) repeat protein